MDGNGGTSARRPGAVPDLVGGTDTDGDGVLDTVLATEPTADGTDLLVHTDLDVDGVVDRVLRIGLDGAVRAEAPAGPDDPVTGSAPAVWPGLLGRLFGSDP